MAKKEAPIKPIKPAAVEPAKVVAIKTYTITVTEMSDGTTRRKSDVIGFSVNEALVQMKMETEAIMGQLLTMWGMFGAPEPTKEG